MSSTDNLKVKIFADGADLPGIIDMSKRSFIKGFTTNPTLMRKAGIGDYKAFAEEILKVVADRPVSFEVFADEFDEMEAQAHEIASWGANVNVKIPVTNTRGEFSGPLIGRLSRDKITVNVTALMTLSQVHAVFDALEGTTPALISVFAGRIADTGRDPMPIMAEAVRLLAQRAATELIWASPRELLNIVHADQVGCHIITVTNDVLAKLPLLGKDLETYSLETVKMFYRDACAAGYSIASRK